MPSLSVKWDDLAQRQIHGKHSFNIGFNDYTPWPAAQHWEHLSGGGRVNSGFAADAKGGEREAHARSTHRHSLLLASCSHVDSQRAPRLSILWRGGGGAAWQQAAPRVTIQ